jgi:hypothetical protein
MVEVGLGPREVKVTQGSPSIETSIGFQNWVLKLFEAREPSLRISDELVRLN